jgi:hypothetical protein
MKLLEKALESVVDEVYRYTLYLIEKSNVPVPHPNKASHRDVVKDLTGIIAGYSGTADDIRAERLGLV